LTSRRRALAGAQRREVGRFRVAHALKAPASELAERDAGREGVETAICVGPDRTIASTKTPKNSSPRASISWPPARCAPMKPIGPAPPGRAAGR
jgi:hypothetical protein